jgi:hypothetical protein
LAQDDLKRYVSHRRLREVAAQALQLPALAAGASEAEEFLLLRPGADDPPQRFALKATRLAAAYLLHCRQRPQGLAFADVGQVEAFRQMQFSLQQHAAGSWACWLLFRLAAHRLCELPASQQKSR